MKQVIDNKLFDSDNCQSLGKVKNQYHFVEFFKSKGHVYFKVFKAYDSEDNDFSLTKLNEAQCKNMIGSLDPDLYFKVFGQVESY